MTNFEKTPLYDRMTDFISIMNENDLRELAEVCKAKADLLQQDRRERQRIELMENLKDALIAIKSEGFSVDIENVDNPNWIVKLLPDDIYSIKMQYVGK